MTTELASSRQATSRNYPWIALANTTAAIFMATVDGSIVLIAMPAIFRGIQLDPLAPGNIGYLLWMIMGYRLVGSVFVVMLGRLGDMFGRVRIYNAGFAVFTVASILLSLTPFTGSQGALWLIGFRVVQGVGGALLLANSTAILTDAFPATQRGMAMGINITEIFVQLLRTLGVRNVRDFIVQPMPDPMVQQQVLLAKPREQPPHPRGAVDLQGVDEFQGVLVVNGEHERRG